jgi:hypothetical protein
MSVNCESEPRKRFPVWLKLAVGFVGVFAFLLLVLAIGGKPPSYKPPYRLSVKAEPKPYRILRTPYRTILSYRVSQSRDETATQIVADLDAQNIRWRVETPVYPRNGYRILDPATPDPSQAEGLQINSDPKDSSKSVIELISPMQTPSRLEIWRYEAEKLLQGRRY